MLKCTDPQLGELLYTYELDLLPEEDMGKFETHLFSCEYCQTQLEGFEKEADLLSKDDGFKKIAQKAAGRRLTSLNSIGEKLYPYLRPITSVFSKPAFAYLLIFLMIIPAYHGLKRRPDRRIRPVQTIQLFFDRAPADDALKIRLKSDGLICFVFEEAVSGKLYQVVIESEGGQTVFRHDAFNNFDEYGTGRLLFPQDKMKPGAYRVILTDPTSAPPFKKRQYEFKIEP